MKEQMETIITRELKYFAVTSMPLCWKLYQGVLIKCVKESLFYVSF